MNSFDYDVFLSHSARDKPMVRQLAHRLKSDGLRVCLDEKGLEQSRTLVLVMSKNAFASDWVTLERHTLLFRDPTNQQRRFIPLLIDPCTIPDTMGKKRDRHPQNFLPTPIDFKEKKEIIFNSKVEVKFPTGGELWNILKGWFRQWW